MKSWRLVDAAISSIAQHASPKFITHSEYRRPQLRMNLTGCGRSTLSTRPTLFHPLEDLLLPGIEQADGEDADEDDHLDENGSLGPQLLELDRPGEEEDAFDVEDHEQEGKEVVADVRVAPSLADRVDAALVRGEFLGARLAGPHEAVSQESDCYEPSPDRGQGTQCRVLPVVAHAVLRTVSEARRCRPIGPTRS